MSRVTRRDFFEDSLLAATWAAAVPMVGGATRAQGSRKKKSPNDVLRVAVIGVRGRGRSHVGSFKRSPDTEVVAICDADEGVVARAMKAVPKAKYVRDIRKLLEDDSIDAVSIATPNHWHSLATIWALQAGKHVYVEKPISHNLVEGRRVIEAAKKYGKVVQHGTQARSHKATIEAMQWLLEGGLGEVKLARGLCYKRRKSIGKVDGPQKPPATCDFDLWTGPAALEPLMRKSMHYDWHWVYNTGNGDVGNQGVHQMDIARWGLGKDSLPTRVVSCGGRLGYDDDGNTPNTQITSFDYGDKQMIFEVRGLKTGPYKTAKIGVVFHCEHGYLVSASYQKVLAFDKDGKQVKEFRGGGDHVKNFIEAIRSGKPADVTASPEDGHISTSLCHLGNISYQTGESQTLDATQTPFGDDDAANESFRRYASHLIENGVDRGSKYTMGTSLAFNPKTERFEGDHAEAANKLLTRKQRPPFVVPDQV